MSEEQELVNARRQQRDPHAQPDDSDDDDNGNGNHNTAGGHHSSKNNSKSSHNKKSNSKEQESEPNDWYFIISAFIIQLIILIFYAVATDYHDASGKVIPCITTTNNNNTNTNSSGLTLNETYLLNITDTPTTTQTTEATEAEICYEIPRDHSDEVYSTYQDVHVMMFIGFGFLMTFLRKYGFGAISFNMLITAVSLQWGMFLFYWIATGKLWEHNQQSNDTRYIFETENLVDGDIAAAAVLISFGAVLGRTSPTQLIWMAFFELIIYSFNFYICVEELHINDVGGSIVVHTFGCYFGLAVSYVLGEPTKTEDNKSMYHSDLFAMIGTLFLWLYWPSFNGFFAGSEGFYRDRAFINTVLSLSSCTVSTFLFSKLFRDGKFDMVHVQNATLAGGVAVGAAADLYIHPSGAMLVGIVAAFVSVIGYCKISDSLENSIGLWDTCGVHNLHGMPGVLGGIVSAIAIWAASSENKDLYYGGAGCKGNGDCHFYYSWGRQGGHQIAALAVTLGISIVGGLVVGSIIKAIDRNNGFHVKSWFHDNDNFVVPKGKTTDLFRGTIRGQQFSRDMQDLDDFDDE